MEQFLFQPLTHWQIVELVGGIGQQDGGYEHADGYEHMGGSRCIGMIDRPLHLQVDERIVGDIEREGYLAKKAVDGRRARPRDTATCADADNEREHQEDDDGVVDTVRPHHRTFIASEARHAQHGENQQRAPPEATF